MKTVEQKRRETYDAGVFAEALACLFLRLKGYKIITKRFKTKSGEIDIIAKTASVIVFVEVKKRVTVNDALACVSSHNISRVRRAAQWWLQCNTRVADNCDIRFDVIAIAPYCWPRHISNAF
jgi:putative endonuclease